MMQVHSLRFRMMLLFCILVGLLLTGACLTFYILMAHKVRSQLDVELLDAAKPVTADLAVDPTDEDISELDVPGEYFELVEPSGRLIKTSRNLRSHPLDFSGLHLALSNPSFQTLDDGSRGRLRVALVPFTQRSQSVVLVVAKSGRDVDQTLRSFRRMVFILLPLGLLLTMTISWWYVGHSLSPISELTKQAEGRTARIRGNIQGEFLTPLSVPNSKDELGHLAQTFNQLFERITSSVRQLHQFVEDAAHELRTPLAVLRGETELLLSQPRTLMEYQERLRIIDDELRKLSCIVEGLFTLSMADARQLRLAREPLYLNEILEEACSLASPRARMKNISLKRDLEQEVPYTGDESFVRQLFLIFLDNAIKYSPWNTSIQVSLHVTADDLRVVFRDEGIGISAQHLPLIFERFYRAAPSDSGEAQSGGLGLAIAQAIVTAMGGSIHCSSVIGEGSIFTVCLPLHHEDSRVASSQVK